MNQNDLSIHPLGWLTVFQSISGRAPERGRKKKQIMIDESKNVQTTPPAPTASVIGPCPTIIKISRTPRYWQFTQHYRTTQPSQIFQVLVIILFL